MNKYEKLIEYIIAEQDDLARQLFHEIVVEKSRHIYESLIEYDMEAEGVHRASRVDDLMDEVAADEMQEAEGDMDDEMPDGMGNEEGDMDMGDEEGDMDMGDEEGDMDDEEGDMDMGDEEDMGDEGDVEELEDRVVDLEAALDELKAEFDALMADEGEEDEGMGEPKEGLREYVEKVSAPANAEGHEVGTGGSVNVNKQSVHAKENRMGGTTPKLGQTGETAPDGQRPHGKAGGFLKSPQEHDVARRNVNKPGGNKGAQDWYHTKAKAKAGEEGSVNKKSIESGN